MNYISRKSFLFVFGYICLLSIIMPRSLHGQTAFDCATYTDLEQSECQASVMILSLVNESSVVAPCDSNVVICHDGTVVELTLDDYELIGLPTEIGQFTNLEALYLWKNSLTSLPDEIRLLTSLEVLDLDENNLTSLPSTIGNLTNLQELRLDHNQLTTLPPEIGQLENLTELHVWNNQLQSLPDGITLLSNLDVVDLDDNMINCTTSEQVRLWVEEQGGECVEPIEPTAIQLKSTTLSHALTLPIAIVTLTFLTLPTSFQAVRQKQ